jgi:cytochrome oxidase assembly protein ShyY1
MSSYRFALRPKWILSHLLIVVLVVVMVSLGFWQLRRLHEKQSANRAITSNTALPETTIDGLLRPGDDFAAGRADAFRRVTATGTYDLANEVIVRARTLAEQPGVWVLTPLRLADGSALLVNRGFLPTAGTPDAVPAAAEPPTGTVVVHGLLQGTETRGTFGATDPTDGHLFDMARADVARVASQTAYPLFPAYLQLKTSEPAQSGDFPKPLPDPVLDEGPHLSYAIQWFLFSAIAVVGYPLILRRQARKGDETPVADEPGDAGDEPVLTA